MLRVAPFPRLKCQCLFLPFLEILQLSVDSSQIILENKVTEEILPITTLCVIKVHSIHVYVYMLTYILYTYMHIYI